MSGPFRPTNPEVLTEQQIDLALEHIIELRPLDLLFKKLGFSSRLAFHKYIKANPDFEQKIDEAKRAACRYLEDDMLYVCDDHDPKAARVKLEAINRLLVILDPKKYSQKIDVSVNQQISIRHALETSDDRLKALARDVSPPVLSDSRSNKK